MFKRLNKEIRQLKRYLKNRNYSDACTHYVTANWLNKELKDRDFKYLVNLIFKLAVKSMKLT